MFSGLSGSFSMSFYPHHYSLSFLTISSHSYLHGEFLLVPVTVYLIYGLLSEGIQSICQIWHKRQAGDQS